MRNQTQLKKIFARVLISLTTLTAPAQITGAGQSSAASPFRQAVTYDSGGMYPDSVAVADVNGDGKPDLVVANYCPSSGCGNGGISGTVGILLGNGDGTFRTAVSYDSGGVGA